MIMLAGLPYYYWQNRSGQVIPVSRKDHFIRIRQAKKNKHKVVKTYDYKVGASVWYELHVPSREKRWRRQLIQIQPRVRMVGQPANLESQRIADFIEATKHPVVLPNDFMGGEPPIRRNEVYQCPQCQRFVNGDGKGHKPDCVDPQPRPPRPEVNPDGSLVIYPPLEGVTQVVRP